jgi:hypothetical protein
MGERGPTDLEIERWQHARINEQPRAMAVVLSLD